MQAEHTRIYLGVLNRVAGCSLTHSLAARR